MWSFLQAIFVGIAVVIFVANMAGYFYEGKLERKAYYLMWMILAAVAIVILKLFEP